MESREKFWEGEALLKNLDWCAAWAMHGRGGVLGLPRNPAESRGKGTVEVARWTRKGPKTGRIPLGMMEHHCAADVEEKSCTSPTLFRQSPSASGRFRKDFRELLAV